jgi:hypothetical protein
VINDLDDLLLDSDFINEKLQEPSVKINIKNGNGMKTVIDIDEVLDEFKDIVSPSEK